MTKLEHLRRELIGASATAAMESDSPLKIERALRMISQLIEEEHSTDRGRVAYEDMDRATFLTAQLEAIAGDLDAARGRGSSQACMMGNRQLASVHKELTSLELADRSQDPYVGKSGEEILAILPDHILPGLPDEVLVQCIREWASRHGAVVRAQRMENGYVTELGPNGWKVAANG